MRISEPSDKYQSSRPIQIILTEGQIQWLMDQPEYVEALDQTRKFHSPLHGALNGIIYQIANQYKRQIGGQ